MKDRNGARTGRLFHHAFSQSSAEGANFPGSNAVSPLQRIGLSWGQRWTRRSQAASERNSLKMQREGLYGLAQWRSAGFYWEESRTDGDAVDAVSIRDFVCRFTRYISASARAHNESAVSPSSGYTAIPMLADTGKCKCRTAIDRSSSS